MKKRETGIAAKSLTAVGIIIAAVVIVWLRSADRQGEQVLDFEIQPEISERVSVAENESAVDRSPIAAPQPSPEGQPLLPSEEPLPEPAKPCSGAVKTIISANATYGERIAVLKDLGHDLSGSDIQTLRLFLEAPLSDYRLRPIALNAVKNNVLALLMEQDEMPQGLGAQVRNMFNNPDTDPMWREYCLQFMPQLLERLSGSSLSTNKGLHNGKSAASPSKGEEQAVVLETILSALEEREGDLAATALLGLSRLSRKSDNIDPERVLQKAVEIAGDIHASDSCRLTALRMAASNGCEDILSVARQLAQNARTDLLKAAAIVSLGDFSQEEDRALLTAMAVSDNRQLALAASMALEKFDPIFQSSLSID